MLCIIYRHCIAFNLSGGMSCNAKIGKKKHYTAFHVNYYISRKFRIHNYLLGVVSAADQPVVWKL